MNIISWNVRGIGSKEKRALVESFIQQHHPSVVILQETKISKVDRFIVKSLWSSRNIAWAFKGSIGASGGIIILWNNPVLSVTDIKVGSFSLTIHITLADGFNFWLTGIYGPPRARDRGLFWDELKELSSLCTEGWLLGGDFNVTRWTFENSSQRRPTRSMNLFNRFITESNLTDLPFQNGLFTWSNLRDSSSLSAGQVSLL